MLPAGSFTISTAFVGAFLASTAVDVVGNVNFLSAALSTGFDPAAIATPAIPGATVFT